MINDNCVMHAFLLIGQENDCNDEIKNLLTRLNAKEFNFPIIKIEDTRSLNDLIRLSFNEKTLIVCKNIENATEEALNALLKNLEEPQDNIYFALTSNSENAVLSTIVSRCQIITVHSTEHKVQSDDVEKFLNSKIGEKLKIVDKIKDRNVAIKLINDLIYILHQKNDFENMETFLLTLRNLRMNGNISLHLTNLVVRMERVND
jgi:DNA polymerase III delta prime subunit